MDDDRSLWRRPTPWLRAVAGMAAMVALSWLAMGVATRPDLEEVEDGGLLLTLHSGHTLAVESDPIGQAFGEPVYRGNLSRSELAFDPPGEAHPSTKGGGVPGLPREPLGPVVYLGDIDGLPLITFSRASLDLPAPINEGMARVLGETMTCVHYANRTTCTSADPDEPFLRTLDVDLPGGGQRMLVAWVGMPADAVVATYEAESTLWQRTRGSSAGFVFHADDLGAGMLTALDRRGNVLLEAEAPGPGP